LCADIRYSRKDFIITSIQDHKLAQRFQQVTKRVTNLLGITFPTRINDRIVSVKWVESSFKYDTPRFGVTEYPRSGTARGGWILTLASLLQNEPPHILEWVLWREAILSLLLPRIRQINEASDLGLFGGIKFGIRDPRLREHLREIWKVISPPQYHTYYQYNPVLGFPMFDSVVDGEFLQRVIPWLNTLRTIYQAPFASTTFTAALERWMLETHLLLNDNEVNILLTLASKPFLTQNQIAEHLSMSPATVSYTLNNLAQRHLLRLFNFINIPLIGLSRYTVILQVLQEETRQQLQNLFSQIHYTHSIRRVSDIVLLSTFLIPNPHIDKFQNWIEQLSNKKNLPKPEIHLVTDLILSRNFQYYTPEVGWPNDFSYLLDKIRHIVLDSLIPSEQLLHICKYDYCKAQSEPRFPLRLMPEDFTFFLRSTEVVSITNRIASRSSKELRKAGFPFSTHMRYRRRIQLLEELEISVSRGFGLFHIGLDTIIDIILRESRASTERLLMAFQLLPYVDAIIFDDGSSEIVLQVPNPVSVDVYSTLRAILADCNFDALISVKPSWQTFVGLPSPIMSKNYDFNIGEWVFTEGTLPEMEK